mmetsp:Transcript_9157/g.27565  ORF Transcript_9157/g.27565 Transcript_9157/m.27565 type:complete len:80 (-) Transcript_9157:1117-1356(-)
MEHVRACRQQAVSRVDFEQLRHADHVPKFDTELIKSTAMKRVPADQSAHHKMAATDLSSRAATADPRPQQARKPGSNAF